MYMFWWSPFWEFYEKVPSSQKINILEYKSLDKIVWDKGKDTWA